MGREVGRGGETGREGEGEKRERKRGRQTERLCKSQAYYFYKGDLVTSSRDFHQKQNNKHNTAVAEV